MSRPASGDANADEKARLRAFQLPVQGTAIWQAVSTFGAFFLLTAAMYVTAKFSVLLTLLLAIPYAGLIVRIFVFQHDFGHNSFFNTIAQNKAAGLLASVVTLTPFAFWRRLHARHHITWNNLDLRGFQADFYTDSLTVAEYEKLTPSGRWLYRVSHHPVLIYLLLPPIYFILLQRAPFDTPASHPEERRSVYALDVVLLLIFGTLIYFFGIKTVLLVHLPAMVLASIIGMWLFAVQHRFEESEWFRKPDWKQNDAALHGTSYLKLPRILRWFSADIGTHHMHHLRPAIPNYSLVDCHNACPAITEGVTTLSFWTALKAPSFTLWDEEHRRMVPFPAR